MTPEQLVDRYPRLWHMADVRNAAGIFRRGLVSTSALLDLFELTGRERAAIESSHRPKSVALSHPGHGIAIVRDQKPLSLSRIESSLTGATPEEFFRFLNGRVFFWPTERRLATMNNARAYRDYDQLIFVVRTESLITRHGAAVLLSPINSGATSPFAWPRSIDMFKSIEAFDYEARRRLPDPIAEVTIAGGIADIFDHVERLEVWRAGERRRALRRPYESVSVVRRLS